VVVATLFASLAALDIATSPDLSFLVFYLLPVLVASWFLGRREGVLVSVACVGVWLLDDSLTRRVYSQPAVPIWNRAGELLFFIFLGWLAGALKTALEREVHARTERLETDLAMARQVQAALLPPRSLVVGPFSVFAVCRQVFGVGGDIYEIQKLGDDRLIVAVADVSGKGIAAALLMSSFLASLRLLIPRYSDQLHTLAEELSERLLTRLETPRFVTAFIGIAEDGWLRYVNAGHNPGFLVGPDSRPAVSLPSTGTVLGLMPRARFHEERVPFPPGSLLVLYSDGLTEQTDSAGEEFGARRVAETAVLARAAPALVVEELLAAVTGHAAAEPLADDITILCVRRDQTRES